MEVPGRSWSHISLDFVTGLVPSLDKTTIHTLIDHFSKAAHFIPLTKLPSATETADFLTNHVFRLYGIPSNVVSDRGPQFVSQVWHNFCTGAKVSLSSGCHPQANGQTERLNLELKATLRYVNNPFFLESTFALD